METANKLYYVNEYSFVGAPRKQLVTTAAKRGNFHQVARRVKLEKNKTQQKTKMSQEEKAETKIVTTTVKIHLAKMYCVSSGKNAGKNQTVELSRRCRYIQRNLKCMKRWSEDDISKIFTDEGRLKRYSRKVANYRTFKSNNTGARVDIVKNTRKLTIAALNLHFKDEKLKNSEFVMPSKLDLKKMAKKLISEQNIRNKFQKYIEYQKTY